MIAALAGLAACADVGGRDLQSTTRLAVDDSTIAIRIDDDVPLPPAALLAWIDRAAQAVRAVYGRFPVEQVTVRVGTGGWRVDGVTYGRDEIVVRLGNDVTAQTLLEDWVLTHEMFHLGFPTLGDRHSWMNEGLSDYLEPIARARLGQISVEQMWKEFVVGMPQGLPRRGEGGLDESPRHGRVYWGGNLYWLLADLEIRRKGGHSVDDAVRAILDAGGDASERWPIDRVIEVGDRATGTTVLRDLYQQHGLRAAAVDLAALWRSLGISVRRGAVTFDDSAPLANVRRAITAAP